MMDIRLRGALAVVWLLFVIVTAFASLLSPAGFSVAVPFRSTFETVIALLLYVPPILFLYSMFNDRDHADTESQTAYQLTGWTFVVLAGGFLAAVLVSFLGFIGFVN